MIQLFFLLSLYKTSMDVTTTTGFQKYPLLAYGFKKNASFYIDISIPTSSMVFGLATKDEIKYIESLSPNDDYCSGNFTLAKIQDKVLYGKNKNISGIILSKGFYIPFSYGCHHEYEYDLELNFLNGNTHRNYLYDIGPIYTMAFGIFEFIMLIIFLLFCIFYVRTKNEYTTYLTILFLLAFIQCVISFFLFEIANQYEYLYYSKLLKYFALANEAIVLTSLILYLILSIKLKNINIRFSGEHLLIAIGCAFFSMVIDLICFFIEIKDKYALGFPSFLLLCVYNYFIIKLSLHSTGLYTHIAILTYTIGYTIINLLNNTAFFIFNEVLSVPIWIISVNIMYLFIFIFSTLFFFLGYVVGHEFESRGSIIKSIYVNTYTNSVINSEAPVLSP